MSKVPIFTDPCDVLIEKIYTIAEHDPNSEDFALFMDEDDRELFADINQETEIYLEEQIDKVKKAYQKQLSILANTLISREISACVELNNEDALQVPNIVLKALEKLNDNDRELQQRQIDLKIIEIFCQKKETVWKSVLYIHNKNIKSTFIKFYYICCIREAIKKGKMSVPFQSQVANITNFYYACITSKRLTQINFISSKDLQNLPSALHDLLSNIWCSIVKNSDREEILHHEINNILLSPPRELLNNNNN